MIMHLKAKVPPSLVADFNNSNTNIVDCALEDYYAVEGPMSVGEFHTEYENLVGYVQSNYGDELVPVEVEVSTRTVQNLREYLSECALYNLPYSNNIEDLILIMFQAWLLQERKFKNVGSSV